MESETYEICQGWATWEGDAAFPTDVMEGMSPDIFTFVLVIKASACLGALQDSRLVC